MLHTLNRRGTIKRSWQITRRTRALSSLKGDGDDSGYHCKTMSPRPQAARLQSNPAKPALHLHVPSARHSPRKRQKFGHRVVSWHSVPAHPVPHMHRPRVQRPLPPVQLEEQAGALQLSPLQLASHSQRPCTHSPCRHPDGHTSTLQSAPENDSSQRHFPATQVPCPEQWPGHVSSPQSSPDQPAAQTQRPAMHSPWPS